MGTDPLSVVLGRKVVVATSAPPAGRLPALLVEVEKAIPVAEQYAVGAMPDYYGVYLASAAASQTWFAKREATTGLAIATGPMHADVVLSNALMRTFPLSLPLILRHELTHAVSIYGIAGVVGGSWRATPPTHHGLSLNPAPVTRSYIHHEWDSTLPELPAADNTKVSTVYALYDLASLAVHRLEMKHGRADLIKFFQQVIRYGATPAMVSPDIFGLPWSTVEADCIAYIKAF